MRIAYLDCFAGIAGDMMLGALVDAGVPPEVLEEATDSMELGASLRFESVDRSGITAIKAHVLSDGGELADVPRASKRPTQDTSQEYSRHPRTQHQHRGGHEFAAVWPEEESPAGASQIRSTDSDDHGRSLTDIRAMIAGSRLSSEVKSLATQAFELLGASEAKIHNVPVDEIHFHEVGAVDAIVDIVASAAGLLHLRVEGWHCSPVNVGGGTVRCAHGLFPVPAPATADLLRGVPSYSAHLQKELTTPTGAALLRALAPTYGSQPVMSVRAIGYGAGTRNPPGFPNVLRLCVGDSTDATLRGRVSSAVSENEPGVESIDALQTISVLETALDDASPQLLAHVAELTLKAGAMDVMLTPVIMKKGRPGTLLTVLAAPADVASLQDLLLRQTTTLGVRIRQEQRVCLSRAHLEVQTAYGKVRVKIGTAQDEILNAHPEFEDCRRLAEEANVPLKQVQAAAIAAFAMARAAERETA